MKNTSKVDFPLKKKSISPSHAVLIIAFAILYLCQTNFLLNFNFPSVLHPRAADESHNVRFLYSIRSIHLSRVNHRIGKKKAQRSFGEARPLLFDVAVFAGGNLETRASPPNKYRVAIRATYRLMEIPEPAAAESFWTLPNHQFSDPLLLRNPRAYPCGSFRLCRFSTCRPLFFFTIYISFTIDRHIFAAFAARNSPDAETKNVFVHRAPFFTFVYLVFQGCKKRGRDYTLFLCVLPMRDR